MSSTGDDSRNNLSSTPVPTSKKVSAHFTAQREFFDKLGKNLEDTDDNRKEVRKIFNEAEENLELSKGIKDKVSSLLESKVTKNWLDVFKRKHSLAETIFDHMTASEKQAYFELDGFKKRADSSQKENYGDAIESLVKFVVGQTTKLDLSRGDIVSLPKCIFNEQLEELDCSYNDGLTELPSESMPCLNLQKVNFTGSGIQRFNFTNSRKLKEINLTSTDLGHLKSAGPEGVDLNRQTIAEGLPLKVRVMIIGLDHGVQRWPKNVIAEDLPNGSTLVTRFSLPAA